MILKKFITDKMANTNAKTPRFRRSVNEPLGIIFKGLLTNYLVFDKIVNLFWQIFYTYGQFFMVLNG